MADPESRAAREPVERKFSSDEICQGIASAVKARDFEAVISLLKLLALQDPHLADVVYQSMLAVLPHD